MTQPTPETPPLTTKRLKELVAKAGPVFRLDFPHGQVSGYRIALSDLDARYGDVVRASARVIASWAAENIEGVDKSQVGYCDLQDLRDALEARKEAQDV